MTQLNVLSGGAAQGLVGALADQIKARTGLTVGGSFGAVGAMRDGAVWTLLLGVITVGLLVWTIRLCAGL